MALKQKSNRTYSGLKADKPATLPAGSIFVDEETPAVWIAKTDETLELLSTRPYKVYTALLNQSGTAAPTALVLENTLGGSPSLTRGAVGDYSITLNGAFTSNKTTVLVGTVGNGDHSATYSSNAYVTSNNQIRIATFDLDTLLLVDDCLLNTFVEIRVYD